MVVVIKKIFQYVLWQDIKKPRKKREILISCLYWALVLILITMFTIVIYELSIHTLWKLILLLYLIPNFLFIGPSRSIAMENKKGKIPNFLMVGGQLTIFFTVLHVIAYEKHIV